MGVIGTNKMQKGDVLMNFELQDDDLEEIAKIRKLGNVTADKLTFTLLLGGALVDAFIAGYLPQYFYYWHTLKYLVLMPIRWFHYKQKRHHYFLLDFCYYTNTLLLIYFWSPWQPNWLFPTVFVFSHGPLLFATVIWRNSIVPHSLDRMTSVFIHLSPALTTWGTRWYSSVKQEFSLCAQPTEPGPNGCNHIGLRELVTGPLVFYLVWMLLYILVVQVWRKERVRKRSYATSVTWMTESTKKGFLYHLFSICGKRYLKIFYFAWLTVYTWVGLLSAFLSYHWMEFGTIIMAFIVLIVCYNGASFYLKVKQHSDYKGKLSNDNNIKEKG
ncbi:PREDICTED: uncharacterized membrane protein C776.05-like [Amphimedon queenslandica]|uniref:Glycerophosphocholine acyltransferase 1 n=1 Tax=Amphimedon queenslandica TaxID=400682 RepID=A0A1X7VNM0_AMPQE|nr:PREDICTED: uncharacterized membrane protein C776.05-like [Amphimedon queenslandica]|eukprot:XP_019861295.1 PREDICTED: uncharacterized membrane protein C776.05-like [Amphimedon queenslandica]